jgi:hypothetical protein
MMSLSKVVPNGLRNRECKRTILREHPPVPYIPEKDEVQEVVSSMKGLQLKTSFGEDKTLHFPMWNNGTKEAMLMLLEEEVPTSSASWSGTLTSLLNTPLRSRLQLP